MKKKIFIIILVVIAIALVSVGVILSIRKSNDNQLSPEPVEKTYYSKEDADDVASQLYKNSESDVEVTTTEDGNYQIVVKDIATGNVKNTFIMDQKTGVISEVPQTTTIVVSDGPVTN